VGPAKKRRCAQALRFGSQTPLRPSVAVWQPSCASLYWRPKASRETILESEEELCHLLKGRAKYRNPFAESESKHRETILGLLR
jgi:hypothetical protein